MARVVSACKRWQSGGHGGNTKKKAKAAGNVTPRPKFQVHHHCRICLLAHGKSDLRRDIHSLCRCVVCLGNEIENEVHLPSASGGSAGAHRRRR